MTAPNNLLEDVAVVAGPVFNDERGYFYEKYNEKFLKDKSVNFIQENISKSKKGTIRGLHWQTEPHAQDKLVTCIIGEIFDVAVDLRRGSHTFGQYCSVVLKDCENMSLWIPKGFAHGFQALTKNAVISYSVTGKYSKNESHTINPLCPYINISWPIKNKVLSKNDSEAPDLNAISNEKIFFN